MSLLRLGFENLFKQHLQMLSLNFILREYQSVLLYLFCISLVHKWECSEPCTYRRQHTLALRRMHLTLNI